jgi:hypothetical protein
MKVNFVGQGIPVSTTFGSLNVNDSYRLLSGEAIYTKVELRQHGIHNSNKYAGLEIATGYVFPCRKEALVVPVQVVVNVHTAKPSIY